MESRPFRPAPPQVSLSRTTRWLATIRRYWLVVQRSACHAPNSLAQDGIARTNRSPGITTLGWRRVVYASRPPAIGSQGHSAMTSTNPPLASEIKILRLPDVCPIGLRSSMIDGLRAPTRCLHNLNLVICTVGLIERNAQAWLDARVDASRAQQKDSVATSPQTRGQPRGRF